MIKFTDYVFFNDFFEDFKVNLQPYEVFKSLKNYIDDSVLGEWISKLDFKEIENQEYAFLEVIQELRSLKKLTIRNSASLTSKWLYQLPKRCFNLTELTLIGCNQLTINDLISLSKSGKGLTLNLGSNQNIKAKEWNHIAKLFENFHLVSEDSNLRFPVNKISPNQFLYHVMTNSNQVEFLEFALLRGAKVNELCKDKGPFYGKNAIHIAAELRLIRPLKFFIENGKGNIKIKDCKERDPLNVALKYDKNNKQ